MASKRDLLRKFLKGIETGSAMAAAVVDEERYIQHNPETREGGEGIAALFARISKTNPTVNFVRVFEDGDFAFAHNEYNFANLKVAFEVFRFEGDRAVEHWDNIQTMAGPNKSGRTMTDGATDISDLDKTEANRALVRAFGETVLVVGEMDRIADYVDHDLIQHDPDLVDGIDALTGLIAGDNPVRHYDKVHCILAEGNFVLSMSEGNKNGVHSGFYDLFRLDSGKIVEHWSNVETIPPPDQRKNDNGKF